MKQKLINIFNHGKRLLFAIKNILFSTTKITSQIVLSTMALVVALVVVIPSVVIAVGAMTKISEVNNVEFSPQVST